MFDQNFNLSFFFLLKSFKRRLFILILYIFLSLFLFTVITEFSKDSEFRQWKCSHKRKLQRKSKKLKSSRLDIDLKYSMQKINNLKIIANERFERNVAIGSKLACKRIPVTSVGSYVNNGSKKYVCIYRNRICFWNYSFFSPQTFLQLFNVSIIFSSCTFNKKHENILKSLFILILIALCMHKHIQFKKT